MDSRIEKYVSTFSESANDTVLAGSLSVLVIVSLFLVLAPGITGDAVSELETVLLVDVGFLFAIALFASVLLLAAIGLGPWGKITLGGDAAEPAYSNLTYFAMLVAIGIAAGIAFFGPGEAVNYMYITVPPGIEESAAARERGIWGMSFTLTHWGIITSATTAVFAVPIAYYRNRDGAPFRVSSALYPLVRNRPALAGMVDVFAISGLVFGLASSTMETIRNFLAGVNFQWGIASQQTGIVLFIIAISLVFTFSAFTGINRGIRRLSLVSLGLFFILSIPTLLFADTVEILRLSAGATAAQPATLATIALNIQAEWTAFWHHLNTAIWFSISAGYGLFTARISYGRSLREIIGYAVVASGLANMFWFYVIGGGVVQKSLVDGGRTQELIAEGGFEVAAFPLLVDFPVGELFLFLFLGIGLMFIINSADSQTLSVAMMTSDETVSPPGIIRVFWGGLIGAIAVMLITIGGADIVGSFAVITGFPLAILAVAALVLTLGSMVREPTADTEQE